MYRPFLAALCVLGLPLSAASAQEMTAQELEALFKSQKTRGLVIAPQPGTETTPQAETQTVTAPDPANPVATAPTSTHVELPREQQVNIQISFDFDSAALRADQKPKLATLCQVLQSIDIERFRIVGHTDASGSAAYNERLSLLRAQEVKRHLVTDCGIAAPRLDAIGVGEEFPFDKSDPRADENRRVEFQALG